DVQPSVRAGGRGHGGDRRRVRLAVGQQAGSGGGTGPGAGGVHGLESVRHRRGGEVYGGGEPSAASQQRSRPWRSSSGRVTSRRSAPTPSSTPRTPRSGAAGASTGRSTAP